MKPTKVFTIPELAKQIGWQRRRLLRRLLDAHRVHGGVLHNIGRSSERPRYTVTLEAIKRIAPEWVEQDETLPERVERTEDEVKRLGRMLEVVVQRVSELGGTNQRRAG